MQIQITLRLALRAPLNLIVRRLETLVSLLHGYPIFFAVAGFLASALLSTRAVSLMNADAKATLVDATASTRLLNVLAIVVFLGMMYWRPTFGWIFLGCAYLGLGARSVFRLKRLNLPPRAARLILIGNICAVAGIAVCAFIFAMRNLL